MLEATVPQPPALSCPRVECDPRWSLFVAILGSTMAFIDGTVVNVALPTIERDMAAAVDSMQWVVESYALLLAALVLVGGALGDKLGRKRVFVAGVVLFTLASVACGLSPTVGFLIGARAVQGIGAAMLVPGSLALIGAAYSDEARPAAIGTWSSATSIAAAIGPLVGGWLVVHVSWRVIFFLNLPFGSAVTVIAWRRVPDTRDPEAPGGTDAIGALLVTVALGVVVWALLEAPNTGGLSSPRTLFALLFGLLLLGVFVAVEARIAAPMVPLALFRSRTFAGANLMTLLLYAALGAGMFFLPFDLIEVQGYSAATAGAALMPFVVAMSLLSRWAGSLVRRRGARLPLVVGPSVAALGFALLAVPSVGGSYVTTFFPGITVLGVGMGVTVAPLTAAVMTSVGSRHAGVASGINNAVSRAAGLLAVAALGVVLVTRFNTELDRALGALKPPPDVVATVLAQRSKLALAEVPASVDPALRHALRSAIDLAFVDGFRTLALICAALAALSAAIAFALIRDEHGAAP